MMEAQASSRKVSDNIRLLVNYNTTQIYKHSHHGRSGHGTSFNHALINGICAQTLTRSATPTQLKDVM